MLKWIRTIKNSSNKTKWFYFQYFIYLLLIVLSTLWAYARLDFVRSYDTEQRKQLNTLDQK